MTLISSYIKSLNFVLEHEYKSSQCDLSFTPDPNVQNRVVVKIDHAFDELNAQELLRDNKEILLAKIESVYKEMGEINETKLNETLENFIQKSTGCTRNQLTHQEVLSVKFKKLVKVYDLISNYHLCTFRTLTSYLKTLIVSIHLQAIKQGQPSFSMDASIMNSGNAKYLYGSASGVDGNIENLYSSQSYSARFSRGVLLGSQPHFRTAPENHRDT